MAPARDDDAWGRSGGSGRARGGGGLTGVAMRLGGKAHKGFRLVATLAPREWGLQCRCACGHGVAWPEPMEYETQPHQGDEHQLVEKEIGDHGKSPHTGRARRVLYPVRQVPELAAS